VARPSKLTPERRKRFIDAIRAGSYVEVAATYAGIGTSTVYRWLAIGREAKRGEHREFWEAVKEAEASAELSAVMRVQAAASDPKNWTAAMTFLERRFRDRWGRPAPGAGGSAMDRAPTEGGEGTGSVTDDVVVIPMADRVAGLMRVMERAGKLPADGSDDSHTNGADPGSVAGVGGEPHRG
jgi:hypothetical protein